MKEIYNIPINGVDYAVGLEWEEIPISKNTNINAEIKSTAKRKGKDYGCKINTPNKIQLGLARYNSKNMTVAACFISKSLKDTLFIKRIDNVDHWVCYVNSEGLIVDGKEGVFGREQLIDIIDELSILGPLIISCSEEDKLDIFREDEDSYEFNIIDFKDIVFDHKKVNDDIAALLVKESNILSKLIIGVVIAAIAGGTYYMLFTDDQAYLDIVNQELSAPLTAKEKAFNKMIKDNQTKLSADIYANSGKQMLKEKIESNIYSKQEIYDYMKNIYETYPLYFYEWEFDSIQFNKSADNRDIKFSVIYKRIENSVGFYNEIQEKALALAKEKFKTFKVTAVPGDANNNIIIINHYFKQPIEIKQNESEAELLAKFDVAKKKNEKEIARIKSQITEVETRVENASFISKKFGSTVSDATIEIEDSVSKGVKMYDTLMKSFKNKGQSEVVIPDSYSNANKNEFMNLAQRNSFYQWKDEKKPALLPPAPTDRKIAESFKPFATAWTFGMNSLDYSTQGIESIKRAVDLLDKTAISIYTVNYTIENESWYIKGELYEKN